MVTSLLKDDKTIVYLRPLKVTICKANPFWEHEGYYNCRKCNRRIYRGQLYGRSRDGRTFCLNCCEGVSRKERYEKVSRSIQSKTS